jgi:K+-sensing histidine kinase KdpD
MIGVPMTYGDILVGVIIISKLGVDKFDQADVRVLEVLAAHAAIAIENARLLGKEREAAKVATELVKLSQALTQIRDVDGVLLATLDVIPAMMDCHGVQAYLREQESGDFVLVAGEMPQMPMTESGQFRVPAVVAEPFLLSLKEPFVLTREMVASVPDEYRTVGIVEDGEVLVSPLKWEPDNVGALVIASGPGDRTFSARELEFSRGIADITSLALGNAARFQELEETSKRLKRLDDMKTMFLEAVSHDLRTPLSSVLGISLTLSRDQGELSVDDTKDLLNRLASNARKLETLLADLLDLDRLAKGIVEPNRRQTDVGALVSAVVEHTEALGTRKVVLDIEPVSIAVDTAKVERIVDNLLTNAVRHTPARSTIWVRVHPSDDGVLIAVDDEGSGVPDELAEEIFEPFRQGPDPNRHSPGVGIGLSLVARFAELHGGKAWVENRPEGGASFRVSIPGPMQPAEASTGGG